MLALDHLEFHIAVDVIFKSPSESCSTFAKISTMKLRQLIIASIGLLIVFLIVFRLTSNTKSDTEDEKEQVAALKYVNVVKVKNGEVPVIIHGYGRVLSSRNVLVAAEVQGKLKNGNVKLKAGNRFKRGDLLFSIDDTEANYSLKSRKSSYLTQLAAALADLKIDFPGEHKKWESFFESIDVEKDLPELPEIKGIKQKTYLASRQILNEYYAIKADEERLKKYHNYAPFDGSIVEVFQEAGAVANPGGQVARIIQHADLEVEVPLSLSDVNFVKKGNPVTLHDQNSNLNWQGTVSRIGGNVDQNSQSVNAYVNVQRNESGNIFDGMYMEVHFEVGSMAESVLLPRKALLNNNSVYYVKDSTLDQKSLEILQWRKDSVIAKGLKDNTLVVAEPLVQVSDSMKVEPIILP